MIFFSLIFLPTLYFSSVQTGISGLVLRDLEALAKVKHCQEEKASDDQPGHRTAWTHSPQTKHPNSVGLSYIRRQRQEIRSFSERKLEDFLRNLFPLLLFDINLYRSCGSKSFCGKWFDSCRGPKEKHPNCLQQRKLTSHGYFSVPGTALVSDLSHVIFLTWNHVAEIKLCTSITSDPHVKQLGWIAGAVLPLTWEYSGT